MPSWPTRPAPDPPGSGTVAALDAGVHAIGKKIVEEAAEVWMAAEHEGTERTAEEISQLLYHLQVLMLATRHLTRRRLHAPLRPRPMLRIAVPNKGSLSEPAAAMLKEAGYRTRRDPKELVVSDVDNGVELFYLRPRDIAVYVGSRHRRLRHHRPRPAARLRLGRRRADGARLRRVDLPVCRPPGHRDRARRRRPVTGSPPATRAWSRSTWPTTASPPSVVRLDGAVETAITLGVADVIADVVETGQTLRSQGLEVFGEPILRSEAVLVRREGSEEQAAVEVLRRRLLGVITARHYVMLDYDVPATLVDRACAITPGLESPTVSHLQNRDWCAVRAMVPRSGTNAVMDELYDLGARAILVTDITACRL